MSQVKALVLRCAGTNCNVETAWALEKVGAVPEQVHVNALLRGEKKVSDYDMAVVPGGFSFGDDVASGKVLANKLLYGLKETLGAFVAAASPRAVSSSAEATPPCMIAPTRRWVSSSTIRRLPAPGPISSGSIRMACRKANAPLL